MKSKNEMKGREQKEDFKKKNTNTRKKKTMLLFLLLLLFWGGVLTSNIVISNASEFINFVNTVNSSPSYIATTVLLNNDLDFTGLSDTFGPLGGQQRKVFPGDHRWAGTHNQQPQVQKFHLPIHWLYWILQRDDNKKHRDS